MKDFLAIIGVAVIAAIVWKFTGVTLAGYATAAIGGTLVAKAV